MKAYVKANELAVALKHSVAPRKTTMNALRFALVTAHPDGRITLETTDSEISVVTTLPADVRQPGAVLMQEDLLHPTAYGDADLHINGADGKVTNGRSHYRVPANEDIGQFPAAEALDFRPVGVDPVQLAAAMQAVSPTGDEDGMHHNLRGLFVEANPGRVWTAESAQISRARIDYTGPGLAIPLYQRKRLLDALTADAVVQVAANGPWATALRVESPTLCVTLRLLGIAPPNIEAVIAQQNKMVGEVHFDIDRAVLVDGIRRLMPFVREGVADKSLPMMLFDTDEGYLRLATRSGDSVETLGLEEMAADKASFALDPTRLLDVLGALPAGDVRLWPPEAAGKGGVVRVRAAGDADGDVIHMLATMTR